MTGIPIMPCNMPDAARSANSQRDQREAFIASVQRVSQYVIDSVEAGAEVRMHCNQPLGAEEILITIHHKAD